MSMNQLISTALYLPIKPKLSEYDRNNLVCEHCKADVYIRPTLGYVNNSIHTHFGPATLCTVPSCDFAPHCTEWCIVGLVLYIHMGIFYRDFNVVLFIYYRSRVSILSGVDTNKLKGSAMHRLRTTGEKTAQNRLFLISIDAYAVHCMEHNISQHGSSPSQPSSETPSDRCDLTCSTTHPAVSPTGPIDASICEAGLLGKSPKSFKYGTCIHDDLDSMPIRLSPPIYSNSAGYKNKIYTANTRGYICTPFCLYLCLIRHASNHSNKFFVFWRMYCEYECQNNILCAESKRCVLECMLVVNLLDPTCQYKE